MKLTGKVADGDEARPPETAWLRTSDVAELLHVSPKTVSRWAKEGRLPFLKTLGGHRRYPESGIVALADVLRGDLDIDAAAAFLAAFAPGGHERGRPE